MTEDEIYKEIERRKQIRQAELLRTRSDAKRTFALIVMVLGLVGVTIGSVLAAMERW